MIKRALKWLLTHDTYCILCWNGNWIGYHDHAFWRHKWGCPFHSGKTVEEEFTEESKPE